jgi:hypothetical protein
LMGEYPSSYLGLGALVSLFFLVFVVPVEVVLKRRSHVGARLWGFVALLMLLAVPGGLIEREQQLLGQYVFRSNNRVSIFIAAVAILFIARALKVIWLRLSKQVSGLATVGVAVIGACGVFEQSADLDIGRPLLGGATPRQARIRWHEMAKSDAAFVQLIEGRLPANAAVVQLPAMPFPEAGPVMGLADYEHFRLYAHASTKLRWSYGSMKGRPEGDYVPRVFSLQAPAAKAQLESDGFGCVVVAVAAMGSSFAESLADAWGLPRSSIIRSNDGSWDAVFFKAL